MKYEAEICYIEVAYYADFGYGFQIRLTVKIDQI